MGKNRKKSSSYRKNARLKQQVELQLRLSPDAVGAFLKPEKKNLGFKNSRRNEFGVEPSDSIMTGAEIVYRILCPSRKIGAVIGRGGDRIKAMRDETHSKIKVDEAVPGTDERVIIIFSSSTKTPGESSADEDLENDSSDGKEHGPMEPHCPAQHALLKVYERIVEQEDPYAASDHEDNKESHLVTVRLLVPSNQVGCLLGKGGNVIQKLRSETEANIRILPPEHLPACAMRDDELVQISGALDVAKKALYEVSTLLYQNPRPPTNHPEPVGGPGFYPSGPPMRNMLPPANPLWSHRNSGFHGQPPMPWGGGFGNEFPRFGHGSFPAGDSGKASAEFSMKILCSADKIRAIIGKKGSNIKQIQQETGAKIHVEDSTDEADERVILVSCFDAPWNPRSPTIDAILRLLVQTYEFSEKGTITTRLLVPSNKVGCLLGQGGHIITEMRRRTQADIRVISKDGKPLCASADDELVQISGKVDFVPNALTEIASRLRVRSLEGVTAASELGPIGGPFQGFGPSEGFFDRGFPPPAMHGPGSSGGYERFKVAPREFEPRSYPVQPSGSGPTGYPNLDSSMEIKIPNSAINAVLGAGGSNISSISQITGAKVKLNNPQAGGSECIVEIHGSSDQMIAAQELLHNFISSAAAAQNYTAQLQQAAAASAGHNYNTQQQQSSYGTDAAQNYSLQYQQHSAHPSSTTNYGAHQQHASPYPSNVQSYSAQQQIASPCASVAQSYGAQKQQHASPYASAVQTYGAQQQHASPYASAVQSYGVQQQSSYATSAAHNYDAQQQNSHTQYGAVAAPQDTQHQQQQQQQRLQQQQQQQQQQRTYSSAAVMYETQQQHGTYQN